MRFANTASNKKIGIGLLALLMSLSLISAQRPEAPGEPRLPGRRNPPEQRPCSGRPSLWTASTMGRSVMWTPMWFRGRLKCITTGMSNNM